MGELGHLMFVGSRSGRYVHVHPVGGDAAHGTVEFEAHFPESGLYKGWGQFKREGRVRVVPLVVEVGQCALASRQRSGWYAATCRH